MLRERSMRSFDPRRLGRLERDAWAGYYRHRWGRVLVSAVGMVRVGFGMSWPRTLHGAWLVLRANQLWAPVPDNDPDGARATMRRFATLYSHLYGVDQADVRLAAAERAAAARHSDQWVADGCDPASPALRDEAAALVRSYALLATVHR